MDGCLYVCHVSIYFIFLTIKFVAATKWKWPQKTKIFQKISTWKEVKVKFRWNRNWTDYRKERREALLLPGQLRPWQTSVGSMSVVHIKASLRPLTFLLRHAYIPEHIPSSKLRNEAHAHTLPMHPHAINFLFVYRASRFSAPTAALCPVCNPAMFLRKREQKN